MTKKVVCAFQFLEAPERPIKGISYWIKDQNDRQVAKGVTNSKGTTFKIERDKNTELIVFVERMHDKTYKKIAKVVLARDAQVFQLYGTKRFYEMETVVHDGGNGQYKRKTYTVKSGDTLSSIADKNKTTVRGLARLNKIVDINKINVGQLLRIPIDDPAEGKSAPPKAAVTQAVPKAAVSKTAPAATKSTASPPATELAPAAAKPALTKPTLPAPLTPATSEKSVVEEAKHKLDEFIKKIETYTADPTPPKADRSAKGGSPKATVDSPCKTKPACIAKGEKSEFIREINIRLAGFGGCLPTDEFTDLTEMCIKQFQKDYMGMKEPTGKICGSLLVALDEFRDKYPVSGYFAKAHCPCGKCSGFGKGRKGISSGINTANEYPGIHRSLIWILKAIQFYLLEEFKNKNLQVAYIESGYRCIDDNANKKRTTVNHMGLALDIHFNKNGKRTKELSDMEFIRKNILSNKMRALEDRTNDHIYLEPKVFKSGANGATTWVHYDITRFSNNYLADKIFKKNIEDLNGQYLIQIAKTFKQNNILFCVGNSSLNPKSTLKTNLDELIARLGTVISHGEGNYESYNTGTINRKVIHSYLNPPAGTITGKSINQILDSQKLSPNNKNRFFASGKYQVIGTTLLEGKERLKLTGNELFNIELQERFFKDYLLEKAGGGGLANFVKRGKGTIDDAQYAAAHEWASIATPKGKEIKDGRISTGSLSYYESPANHANPESTRQLKALLQEIQELRIEEQL